MHYHTFTWTHGVWMDVHHDQIMSATYYSRAYHRKISIVRESIIVNKNNNLFKLEPYDGTIH